ncbi:hypothetical protein PG279_00255 [Riemerella anatipestifer]|nr:hypothetical protein [Riemerella anatipestifer]
MKKKGNYILLVFISIMMVVELLRYLLNPLQVDSYFVENALINYSAGFVRRGISGELLVFLQEITGLHLYTLIKVVNIVLLTVIYMFLLRGFNRHNYSFFILFFPFLLPFLLLDNIINFKDLFTTVLFICVMKSFFIKHNGVKFFFVNFFGIVAVLNHEMSFFLIFPVLLVISYLKDRSISKLFSTFYFLFPMIIVLILTLVYSGTLEQSIQIKSNIYDLLNISKNARKEPYIKYLADKTNFILPELFNSIIWNGFSRGVVHVFYFIQLVFLFVFIDKIRYDGERSINPTISIGLFFIQFISMLPIFFIAYDWHRFFNLISLTTLILIVILSDYSNKWFIVDSRVLNDVREVVGKYVYTHRSFVLFIGFFGIIPHMKMGNSLEYQFTNLYLIMMNYLSKLMYVIL